VALGPPEVPDNLEVRGRGDAQTHLRGMSI
jgi:hypothetical protein